MRALLRHPVVQFLAVALVTLVVIVVATGRLSREAAEAEAVADARAATELLARSVVEPLLPRGLLQEDPGAIDRLDAVMMRRMEDVPELERVKMWSRDGRIIWSDEPRLILRRFSLGADELEILEEGGTAAEVSDLGRPENELDPRGEGGLLEVYTRVETPEGDPLLLEVYFDGTNIDEQGEEVFRSFRPITLGALGVLLAVATPLLWVLTRRLNRAAEDRERLLKVAVAASDAERIRIARDLHDGVVQDLAGTSFAVSALARGNGLPSKTRHELARTSSSLRGALHQLRSLMVEIYPPDLQSAGLRAALQDLLAPAEASGLKVTLVVDGVEDVSEEVAALVWRIAQEAVRNALRHARASSLTVSVSREDDGMVRLKVADDGVGFDPRHQVGRTQFGLRGLASLAADAGGQLEVDTRPGAGTTVCLTVADR